MHHFVIVIHHIHGVCHVGLVEEEKEKFLHDVFLALQDHLIKEWFTFGLHLDLNVTELNVLETNSFAYADKRTAVRHMLTKWKNRFGEKATWDKIVDALREIGRNALAQDLKDKHMQPEVKETGECLYYSYHIIGLIACVHELVWSGIHYHARELLN